MLSYYRYKINSATDFGSPTLNTANQPNTKTGVRDFVVAFGTLLLFWLMLSAKLDGQTLLIGIVVSLAIALLFRRTFNNCLTFFNEFKFTPAAFIAGFGYFIYFFWQILKSNLAMAKIVLSPSLPINPGIVRGKTILKSNMGRMMLANSITLTPGTLTVELDGDSIYLHIVNMQGDDLEAEAEKIISGFEKYLKVIYG